MTLDLDKVARLQDADRELLAAKNAAYGNVGLRSTGMEGIATRIIDKAHRLLNLHRNPEFDVGDESVRDTLADVSNYGLLGRMLDDESMLNRPHSVYLCGPIDMANHEMRIKWRNVAKTVFAAYGVPTFDPSGAWHGGAENLEAKRAIMDIDYHAVYTTDMTLAHLPPDVPTIGSIREIEYARSQGKRVVVASPWVRTSAFSADLEVYDTVPEALCAILEISHDSYNDMIHEIYGQPEAGEKIDRDKYVATTGGTDGPRTENRESDSHRIKRSRMPLNQNESAR